MGTIRNEPYISPGQAITENSGTSSVNPQTNLPISPKKVKKIRKFLKCFIAVDNDVNEQTVMGVVFTVVTLTIIALHVAQIGQAGIDLIVTTGTMTLSCFGIAGLKR